MQQTNLSTATATSTNISQSDDANSARLMAAMTAFMAADFVDDIAFAVAQESATQANMIPETSANQNASQYTPARRAA
jgi:hypothetical protein